MWHTCHSLRAPDSVPHQIIAAGWRGWHGRSVSSARYRLDRSVAIKVLPAHLSSNLELKVRFEREARAISSLQHAHIFVLHDIGHQDGIHYLVMEFLEGETLEGSLRKGPLPVDQAIKIGIEIAGGVLELGHYQIADALDKAHRRGIVHRDLKPQDA